MPQDIFKLKSLFLNGANQVGQAGKAAPKKAIKSKESIFTPKGQSSSGASKLNGVAENSEITGPFKPVVEIQSTDRITGVGPTVTYGTDGKTAEQKKLTYYPDGNVKTKSISYYRNDEITRQEDYTYYPNGNIKTDSILFYENGEARGRSEDIFHPDGKFSSFSIYNREGELIYAFDRASKDVELAAMETSDESGYTVKYDDNIIIVETEAREEAARIDLDILLSEFKEENRAHMADEIKKLPPQALADLYNENVLLDILERHDCDTVAPDTTAHYHRDEDGDKVYVIEDNFTAVIFAHELGHVIDDFLSTPSNAAESPVPQFVETFNREKEAFFRDVELDEEFLSPGLFYGMQNATEAFAEIYTLITFPELAATSIRYDILQHYFPETIAEAKNYLEFVRALPQEHRRRPW